MLPSDTLITPEMVKKQAWDQYWRLTKARLDTIELLKMLGEKEFPEVKAEETDHLNLRDLIRIAVKHSPERFSRDIALKYILDNYPRSINESSFGVTFNQLAKSEDWLTIERGVGGNPSVYSLLKDPVNLLKKCGATLTATLYQEVYGELRGKVFWDDLFEWGTFYPLTGTRIFFKKNEVFELELEVISGSFVIYPTSSEDFNETDVLTFRIKD